MATISHKNLPNAQLHECKGASTATAQKALIASGAGTATFKTINPHGAIYFIDLSTPYTLTYPSAFAKAAPTTIASGTGVDFTESTTARLTYTGTDTMMGRLVFNVSLDQAAGANRDIVLAVYKNGSIITSSQVINTTSSAVKVLTTSIVDVSMATNDYFEAYIKNNGAGGDVNIYSFYLTATGFRS